MASMTDEYGNILSGSNSSNHSGFNGKLVEGGSLVAGYDWPKECYYDIYINNESANNFTKGILGDATTEMGPFASVSYETLTKRILSSWYQDLAFSNSTANMIYTRGGDYSYGSESGIFSFASTDGRLKVASRSFRVIITPSS